MILKIDDYSMELQATHLFFKWFQIMFAGKTVTLLGRQLVHTNSAISPHTSVQKLICPSVHCETVQNVTENPNSRIQFPRLSITDAWSRPARSIAWLHCTCSSQRKFSWPKLLKLSFNPIRSIWWFRWLLQLW